MTGTAAARAIPTCATHCCQLPCSQGSVIHPSHIVSPRSAQKLGRGGRKALSRPRLCLCVCKASGHAYGLLLQSKPYSAFGTKHSQQKCSSSALDFRCSKIILCVCICSVIIHCSQEEVSVLAERGAWQGRSVSLLLQQSQLWKML